MDKKILKALKESIQSWKTRKIKSVDDMGGHRCELCKVVSDCECCPIGIAGHLGCRGTPYEELFSYFIHSKIKHDPKIVEQYRQEEIAFLESLLPEGETCEEKES